MRDPVLTREMFGFIVLADLSDDFFCLTGMQGLPFYLNAAGRKMVGLDEDCDAASVNLEKLHVEPPWATLRDTAVLAGPGAALWEGSGRLSNVRTSEIIEVRTKVLSVRHPQTELPLGLAIIHRLPHENPQLQASLRENVARKHAILESSLDPIITINHAGVITEFNRAAEQTFGHRRDRVLGTRPSEILFPPSKSAGFGNRIDRYLNANEGSMLGRRIEVTAVRANGETFPAEMAMTINQEQGLPVMTFFVRDISHRKKAEQDQARHAAELERSNRDLEQFAYAVSHDLQEPLRKIHTLAERILRRSRDLLAEADRDYLARIEDAARRMQGLIDALLSLSRVTTKARNFMPVDLATIAAEVVTDLELPIEAADAAVEIGDLPTIQADPVQMRQLFQNLIGNALKFRRPDEPLVVKVRGRLIMPLEQRRNNSFPKKLCRIVVEDNGIGFEEEYAERIFGVFQRLHPRSVYEGTGVGLAICRKIAERHGGNISARGKPGVGSSFTIVLPAVHRDKVN